MLLYVLCCSFWPAVGTTAAAGGLVVSVVDRRAAPVDDVVVFAAPASGRVQAGAPRARAIMDQRHRQFVPHILVVQTGTLVDFPNNDSVSHHVYSFSPARPFELALYKGDPHPPIEFDKAGPVVLGCNIHDNMIGYIYVVDTPYFAKTGGDGRADLGALPPGRYYVRVWTPRLREKDLPAAVTIELPADADRPLAFRLEGRMAPPQALGGSTLQWTDY